jgi:MoxR-vWA-beta-propeller ternary system domain bpX5
VTAPSWRRREPPLPYAAVAATGPAATRLAAATADRIADGAALRATAGQGWLVVLGQPADLPWTDGVTYLGWDAGVLVPTTRAVSPPVPLIRAALGAGPADLLVLLPDAALISPLPVRTADPARLTASL